MSKQAINWGILSTAQIGINRAIPALQDSDNGNVVAIASRNEVVAREAAAKLIIPKYYGGYEALLADPDIDAIYNPLPNHLHVEWTIKALEAGKHVLCEKPVGMNTKDAEKLIEATKKYPHLKVMEAFMYRFLPQWDMIKKIIADGTLGEIQHIQSHFSYHNSDPKNIRNIADVGGGALMDIGCYCISLSRSLFKAEPTSALGQMTMNPESKTDILTSGILNFNNNRTASFTCATLMSRHEQADIFGTKGHLRVEFPFNPPPVPNIHMYLTSSGSSETITIRREDQFKIQGEAFAKAILENTDVPTPLEDALGNMKVIDAIKKSALSGGVETI